MVNILSAELGRKFQRKVPFEFPYNSVLVRPSSKKIPKPKVMLDSFIRFDRTPTCEPEVYSYRSAARAGPSHANK